MSEKDHFEAGIATLAADSIDQFQDKAPWTVNGVALPVNTIVNGGQNTDHYYPEEVLQDAGELLEGNPIVKNFHELEGQASADDVIGEVKSAGYQKGVGLVFEGEVTDPEIAQKIKQGYLDVSPTPARALGEFDDDMGAQMVDKLVDFRDMAVVANGQPGAKVEMGSNPAIEALSMDALSRGWDTLESDSKTVAGVSFIGTRDGKLDESEIEDNFGDHALYGEGENKGDYSYWVVDAEGYLRKGNVESAWQLGCRGQCPSDDTHDSNLMNLAEEFDSPPEFAQEEPDSMGDEPNDDSDDGTVSVLETVEVNENPNVINVE